VNLQRAMLLDFCFLRRELGVSTFLVVYLTEHTSMTTGAAMVASGASA
jgi:hypothetical protein